MKKLQLFCVSIAACLITACTSNNDAPVSLVGTWKLTSYTLEGSYDINGDGVSSNDVISETNGCFLDDTWVFNSDQTGMTTQSSVITLAAPGSGAPVTCYRNNIPQDFTWSIDNSTDEVIVDFGPTGFRCVLIGNTLVYTRPDVGLAAFVSGNPNVVDNETIIYTKQ